ncbi:EspA/EspE family type VII secretion system effector [Mycobacterium sp. 050134]|uniref:EspA/EspE family type VII secretion system effector n=1 Tax=Mycobacterium sp. 050134 TaxID=3096111 RepID=UPI002EDB7D48
MSIFADAARTLAAIAGLSGQFAGSNLSDRGYSGGYSPETIAASLASGGADLGMLAKQPIQSLVGRGARYLNSRGVIKLPTDNFTGRLYSKGAGDSLKFTSIISWTYTVVEMLELTTGFGPAYEGDALKDGSKAFAELSQLLHSAVPDKTWQGSGSEAYAQLSAALQQLAIATAGLDTKLADAVKGHAELVNHMRLGFGLLKDLLFAAMVIEMLIAFIPAPVGPTVAKAFAIAVAAAGIATATAFIATLVSNSFEAGAEAEDLMNQYNELLYQTGQKGQLTQTSAATSAESTVSDFQAISNSMSAGSAPSPHAFRAAEGPTAYRTNTEDTALTVTQSKTTTGGAGTSSFTLPTITLPTLAQVSTMSGQSARISGQLAQHVNLFNQAMGQVQQIAQMAQQNQPAPPPAPDTETATDVNAKTGEDTDAAAGSPDGQRAPVEQTAPGAPPAQPRGERIL